MFDVALAAALADVIDHFTDALVVIIPITFGIAGLALAYNRVKGLIH